MHAGRVLRPPCDERSPLGLGLRTARNAVTPQRGRSVARRGTCLALASLDVKDVTWINASGAEMRTDEWSDEQMRCFGMLMDGRAAPTGVRQRGQEATLLLVLNAHHESVPFTLPSAPGGEAWRLLVDTHAPDDSEERKFDFTTQYDAQERSAALFSLA